MTQERQIIDIQKEIIDILKSLCDAKSDLIGSLLEAMKIYDVLDSSAVYVKKYLDSSEQLERKLETLEKILLTDETNR